MHHCISVVPASHLKPRWGSQGSPRMGCKGCQESRSPNTVPAHFPPQPAEDTAVTIQDKCSQPHVLPVAWFSISDIKQYLASRSLCTRQGDLGLAVSQMGLSSWSWRQAASLRPFCTITTWHLLGCRESTGLAEEMA